MAGILRSAYALGKGVARFYRSDLAKVGAIASTPLTVGQLATLNTKALPGEDTQARTFDDPKEEDQPQEAYSQYNPYIRQQPESLPFEGDQRRPSRRMILSEPQSFDSTGYDTIGGEGHPFNPYVSDVRFNGYGPSGYASIRKRRKRIRVKKSRVHIC